MTRAIEQIPVDHRAWLADPSKRRRIVWSMLCTEERGELVTADLSRADLSFSDLSRADLEGADLTGAKFVGADLTDAALCGANLTRADLTDAALCSANLTRAVLTGTKISGADLTGAVGLFELPVGDPRGYRCVAVWHGDHWMISAGCRRGTVAEARAHWGAADYPDRARGDRYLRAFDWLEAQPTPTLEGDAT